MTKVILLDTETTGSSNTDQIIELAYVELFEINEFRTHELGYKEETLFNQRYMPSVPINPHAFKCHGITYKELLGKPKSESIEFPKNIKYMIGHNIKFDHRYLGKPEVKLICTWDLCKKMDKYLKIGFENHKLDTLAKHLAPDHDLLKKHHSASGDIIKNIIVLKKLLEKLPNITSWDDMYEFLELMKSTK